MLENTISEEKETMDIADLLGHYKKIESGEISDPNELKDAINTVSENTIRFLKSNKNTKRNWIIGRILVNMLRYITTPFEFQKQASDELYLALNTCIKSLDVERESLVTIKEHAKKMKATNNSNGLVLSMGLLLMSQLIGEEVEKFLEVSTTTWRSSLSRISYYPTTEITQDKINEYFEEISTRTSELRETTNSL